MQTTRPVVAGLLAIFALLAVFCVIDQDTSAHEFIAKSSGEEEPLVGNKYLESQKKELDDARALRNKGKDMASFDAMLHRFQSAGEDKALTKALKLRAPKRELSVVLPPDRNGNVRMPGDKPEKKNPFSFNDMSLLQLDRLQDTSWIPSGQDDLEEQIALARAKEEEAEAKEYSDEEALLAVRHKSKDLDLYDARDTMFLQESASWDDEEEQESWKPKGQADMMEQNYYAQIKAKKKAKGNDDLLGETVISAIGLEDQTIKKNKDWEFDLELVQTQASEDDGKAPETFFLQQQSEDEEDSVRSWSPKGQQIGASHNYEAHKKKAKKAKKHLPYWDKDDDGVDDILSAAKLSTSWRTNEVDRIGTIHADEFDIGNLLD